nr:MAG TPA: Nucleotide modification associated domain 1 [Caudoviricetes sp.]
MTKVEMHKALCEELNRIYEKKNHDYGDSFHQTFLEEGMAMPRIRLSDKLSRFKALTRNGGQEVNDESIRDTLLDLANYALMTAMELTEYTELYADDKPVAAIRVNPHALPRKV